MKNNLPVETNLTDLIAKMGEKITIRRSIFFDNSNGKNSFYIHGALEDKIGKIYQLLKLQKKMRVGKKIAMHVSALSPMALEEKSLSKEIIRQRNRNY